MIDKLNQIIELLDIDNKGIEPEYLNIKTPIKEDPKGYHVAIMYTHRDGEICDSPEWRGDNLEEILDRIIFYLKDREAPVLFGDDLGDSLKDNA